MFVAAYPPAAAVDDLAGYTARLHTVRAGARVARTDTWHVTLAFLADVPDDRLPDLTHAVNLAAASVHDPVRLRVSGGGTFGRGRSTVLWAGLAGTVPELVELARAVRRALARVRLAYDPKPVRPHLTLARPGDRVAADLVAADVAELGGYAGPEWTVGELLVMESHLGAVARYDVRHAAPLPGQPPGRA